MDLEIKQALVIDLSPDPKVKSAMNDINAQKRLREAAKEKAEADKITQVKGAEAEAEAKYLQGVGVARQRQAIVNGFKDSVNEFSGHVAGATPKDVMNIMMITQYLGMEWLYECLHHFGSILSVYRIYFLLVNAVFNYFLDLFEMWLLVIVDMLKDVGTTSSRDTLFIPHTPNALTDIQMQVKAGLEASTSGPTPDLLSGQ